MAEEASLSESLGPGVSDLDLNSLDLDSFSRWEKRAPLPILKDCVRLGKVKITIPAFFQGRFDGYSNVINLFDIDSGILILVPSNDDAEFKLMRPKASKHVSGAKSHSGGMTVSYSGFLKFYKGLTNTEPIGYVKAVWTDKLEHPKGNRIGGLVIFLHTVTDVKGNVLE